MLRGNALWRGYVYNKRQLRMYMDEDEIELLNMSQEDMERIANGDES